MPQVAGRMRTSRMRSGVCERTTERPARRSRAWSTPRPVAASRRSRNAAMSGSSSTTRTRKLALAGASRAGAAISFIGDLDAGEVFAVLADARFQAGPIAAARAVLDVLADGRDVIEAIGDSDALHPVPQLAQLLEIGGGERHLERVVLLLPVAHEGRDQVLQVLGNLDCAELFVHGADYRRPGRDSRQALSDSASRA